MTSASLATNPPNGNSRPQSQSAPLSIGPRFFPTMPLVLGLSAPLIAAYVEAKETEKVASG